MLLKVIQSSFIALSFVIPIVGNLTIDNDTVFKNENRTAFAYPTSFKNIDWDFLQKALNDRLFLRQEVQVNTSKLLESTLSQHSDFDPGSAFAMKGTKYGWYFAGDIHDKVYSKHTRDLNYQDPHFEKHLSLLLRLSTITPKTYLIVGPDKAGVYSELMNPLIGHPGKYRDFEKLKARFEQANIKVIDNLDAIKSQKDLSFKTSLYFTNDTHWNLKAGYHAFNHTLKTILGNDFKPIEYTFKWSKSLIGDLNQNTEIGSKKDILDKVSPINTTEAECTAVDIENNLKKTATRQFGTETPIICADDFVSCNFQYTKNSLYKSKLKVALISDSFGHNFRPYFFDYFNETLWCNAYDSHGKIVKYVTEFKPDVILYLRAERSL